MIPEEYRFDIFGRSTIAVTRTAGSGWRAFLVGDDGKRAPAGIEVPDFIERDELLQFLADLFHESARPGGRDAREIPRAEWVR